MTKPLLLTALVAASFPALADTKPESCVQYEKDVKAWMQKEGAYTEETASMIRNQIDAIPAAQRDEFCKSAISSLSAANKSSEKEEKKK